MVKISAARLDLEGGRVDNGTLKNYAEALVGGFGGANSGSTYTVDLAQGNAFYVVLNANCAFTFSNPTATGNVSYFTLLLKQDGTGGRVPVWPFVVAWPGDIPPTLTTVPGQWDILFFMTVNGGGTWYGNISGSSYR